MTRTNGTRFWIILALVIVLLLTGSQQASAWGICHGYWGRPVVWYGGLHHAYYPHYTYYYTPVYTWSSWGWGGCYWGCGGCSSCCYDYSICGCGCYDCGWWDCCPSHAKSDEPTPAQAPEAPNNNDAAQTLQKNSALLSVRVPDGAKVFVNGRATSSSGTNRRYVARDLKPGMNYAFEVRAEMQRDGETVTETKTVKLQSDGVADLAFDFGSESIQQVSLKPMRTVLTVHVPPGAQVWLEGKKTKSTGPVRRFATMQLTAGQAWRDYRIRVEINQDGRPVVLEKTVTLSAGQTHEVRFDAPAPRVTGVESAAQVRLAANH